MCEPVEGRLSHAPMLSSVIKAIVILHVASLHAASGGRLATALPHAAMRVARVPAHAAATPWPQ